MEKSRPAKSSSKPAEAIEKSRLAMLRWSNRRNDGWAAHKPIERTRKRSPIRIGNISKDNKLRRRERCNKKLDKSNTAAKIKSRISKELEMSIESGKRDTAATNWWNTTRLKSADPCKSAEMVPVRASPPVAAE